MTIGGLSGYMDDLVSQSRSTRDSAFNALDAVNRDSRRAGAELTARVAARVAEQQAKEKASGPDEDAAKKAAEPSTPDPPNPDANRFAPEDEWELVAPQTPAPPTAPPPSAPRAVDDDEDDYPATWLR